MNSVAELLTRAKTAIAAGENSLREAAEAIAAAQAQGASQRQMAAAVGKSAAWVNRLLAWRHTGFIGDAFGPESRKPRRIGVQPAEHRSSSEGSFASESVGAEPASEEPSEGPPKQRSNVREPNFDWDWLQEELRNLSFEPQASRPRTMDVSVRNTIVKALGMLGSEHDGEVLNAARAAENQRRKLGLTWDQLLIVPSELDLAA